MTSSIKTECFINGVEYKCRTCFDPGQTVHFLTDEAGIGKTWLDLLNDIGKLQISDDDLLPNTVCSKCLEKLKSIYDFILQMEYVNKEYLKLLESCNDPLHEVVLNDGDNLTNCLAIDLPLEQDISKIKLEEELIDPYKIALGDTNQLSEDCETKFENEETDDHDDDPFSKTYDDFTSISEPLEEKESLNTTDKCKTKLKLHRKSAALEEEKNSDKSKCPQTRRRLSRSVKKPKECTNQLPTEKQKHSNEDNHDDDNLIVKPNVCPYCSKVFRYKNVVEDHVRSVHEKLKPFKCSKCDKTFSSKQSVRSHELSHTDNFPFQCEYCDRRFRIKHKLKIHTELHTTKPELLCPICKRAQKSTKDLEDHVKAHNDKRLQCNSCGRLFNRNSALNDHYNAVHLKLRPYKCQYCELGFGDRKTRRMHERKHHPRETAIALSICKNDVKAPAKKDSNHTTEEYKSIYKI